MVRYFKPRNATHEASVLCTHLARFVQQELDTYAKFNPDFPPQSTRPQGVLVITDRSMDLVAPLMHEFTYQAMAHDLLPIKDGDKVTYKTVINAGQPDQEEKEIEIGEKDEIWCKNRHEHMKDTIDRIMNDFNKFIADNPHFTNQDNAASLNAIKDMLAGLPQFTSLKEAYSLHLSMAQECMNIFQRHKLPDVASLEQTLATGLDEDYRKPKNVADNLVRLLDDDAIAPTDRLRLIMLYILFKDGIVAEDIPRLLAHAQLPPHSLDAITNLELIGAHTTRGLKETRSAPQPLFTHKTAPAQQDEEYALSRFEPALKQLLDNLGSGTLDTNTFPYVRPPLADGSEAAALNSSSLRSAKPTWAQNRRSMHESKQRVILFMAGGATYSESRAVYEASSRGNRDVVLVTSHMMAPGMFVRQVEELSRDRRALNLPADQPRKRAPDHLFEREQVKVPPKPQPPVPVNIPRQGGGLSPPERPTTGRPPTGDGRSDLSGRMVAMNIGGSAGQGSSGHAPHKLEKKKDKHGEDGKEKKKRGFFSSKKDKK